jgi:hypothetical protein
MWEASGIPSVYYVHVHRTTVSEFAVRSILGAARVPACWSWVCSWLARPTARRRWPGGRFTSVCASAVRYEHHLYDHCLHCGLCLGFGILLAADAGLLETLHGHAILRSHAWKYAVMRNAPHVENRSVMPSRPFSDWFALRDSCPLTDPYWLAAHRKSFRALLAACRQKIKCLLLSEPPFIWLHLALRERQAKARQRSRVHKTPTSHSGR